MPVMPRRQTQCPRCLHIGAELRGGVPRLVVRIGLVLGLGWFFVAWVSEGIGGAVHLLRDTWMVWAPVAILSVVLPGPRVFCPDCDAKQPDTADRGSE